MRTYTNNCINKYSTREIEGETVLGMKSDFQKSTALISVAVFIKWTERGWKKFFSSKPEDSRISWSSSCHIYQHSLYWFIKMQKCNWKILECKLVAGLSMFGSCFIQKIKIWYHLILNFKFKSPCKTKLPLVCSGFCKGEYACDKFILWLAGQVAMCICFVLLQNQK